MSLHLNFLDVYGFVLEKRLYRAVKGFPEDYLDIRTKRYVLAYFPLIAQIAGLIHMLAAICRDEPASYRLGLFIRGFVEFTYVLTPLLILADLVVTAVRSYQLKQALRDSRVVNQ